MGDLFLTNFRLVSNRTFVQDQTILNNAVISDFAVAEDDGVADLGFCADLHISSNHGLLNTSFLANLDRRQFATQDCDVRHFDLADLSVGQGEDVWDVVLSGLEHLIFISKLRHVSVFDGHQLTFEVRILIKFDVFEAHIRVPRGMWINVRHNLNLVLFLHLKIWVHEQLDLGFHIFVLVSSSFPAVHGLIHHFLEVLLKLISCKVR